MQADVMDEPVSDPEQGELLSAEPVQAELIATGRLQQALEGVLFVASEALSIRQLAKFTGATEVEVTAALAHIEADFSGRGMVLREVAGGYRFASAQGARAAVEAYLLPPKTNLSPAALETLAIVAYNEFLNDSPTTKGEIEAIRGVNADSVIATLIDRRFIVESGRKDVVGRPIIYKTTSEFLEAFGLRSLEELPKIDFDSDKALTLNLEEQATAQAALPGVASNESDSEQFPERATPADAAETDAVSDTDAEVREN